MLVIAIDFDGTLVEDHWPGIGPRTKWFDLALKLKKHYKLILWTCRTNEHLDNAVKFCKQHGLEFDAVNENLPHIVLHYGTDNRKVSADIYIDDRTFNIHCKNCMDKLEKLTINDTIDSRMIKDIFKEVEPVMSKVNETYKR
jgi:hydroxymethylpyrimidine pyrophosphatase-like HAD family hydrolase